VPVVAHHVPSRFMCIFHHAIITDVNGPLHHLPWNPVLLVKRDFSSIW
jgi:hypothetical protein